MNTNPNTTYTSPNKRPYRVAGIGKTKTGWFTAIKFLDTNDNAILHYSNQGKVIKITDEIC